MTLYFDIGNSSIKVNFKTEGKQFYVSYSSRVEYSVDQFYQMLPTKIKDLKIDKVVIISVVPKQEAILRGMVKKYWQIIPLRITYPIKTSIKIKANDPKSVGNDLVALAVLGASKGDNVIILNLGTATTLTHVKDNVFQGAVIVPGLHTSLNALFNKASGLSEFDLTLPKNKKIGNSTNEAISIGVISGTIHMLKGLINDIDPEAKIIITGGNARKMKMYVPEYEFIKEGTIEGAKLIEAMNE